MRFGLPNALLIAALLGAALPDFLRIAKGRHASMPGWLKSGFFYLGFVILLILGYSAVRLAYSANPELAFVEALAVAYAAPDFLTKLVSKQGSDNQIASSDPSLRKWWAL